MKCNFVVGQKVVCVVDEWSKAGMMVLLAHGPHQFPKKGCIYTIRNIDVFPGGYIYLHFVEIVNPVISFDHGDWEQGWDHRRFRPLIERKTDISVFKAMLTPAGRIPVDA